MSKNYYDVLGVDEKSTQSEIKKAYRKLSLQYHPDRNNNDLIATEKTKDINEAYETLGNETNRKQYDMSKNNPFARMFSMDGSSGNMPPMPPDLDNLLSQVFGMNNSFPHGGNGFQSFNMGMSMDGKGIHVFTNIKKPVPIVKNINVNLEDVYTGKSIPINVERWIIEKGNSEKNFEKETIYISLPKGIDNNEIIILKEKGNVIDDSVKGDIKIIISLDEHPIFKRDGLNLHYNKQISLKEALCGLTYEFKHLNGKVFTITNKKGNIIQNEHTKNIPNLGLTRDNYTGVLVIHFEILFPKELSIENINKLEELLT